MSNEHVWNDESRDERREMSVALHNVPREPSPGAPGFGLV